MTRVVHHLNHPYDVYIGRPSKWGNPFFKGTRSENIANYEKWIRENPKLLAQLPELKGKTLGCWCHPRPCHGDVLVALLEEMEPNKLIEY